MYDTWNSQKLSSCKATSSDAMISRAMKSHTNEHTVRSRPTLKVVKRFRKLKGRSTRLTRDQHWFTSERFEWIYQESCYAVLCHGASYQPGLSTLHLDKKHLRSVIVFLDVTVNQVGSQHELPTSVKRRKVREYVSVVYELCICSHACSSTPK